MWQCLFRTEKLEEDKLEIEQHEKQHKIQQQQEEKNAQELRVHLEKKNDDNNDNNDNSDSINYNVTDLNCSKIKIQ
jgi:hypothetical protein